jgi:hypothetical protein
MYSNRLKPPKRDNSPQQIAGREREERPPERIPVPGQHRQIVELHGPERIQTAWWTDQPCHRDYFRAITETGGQLWNAANQALNYELWINYLGVPGQRKIV